MKEQLFSTLSFVRRILRRLRIARLVIRAPYVSRLFWYTYHHLRPRGVTMVTVKDFGFRMYVDPQDQAVSCTLLMLGCYEPFASQVFSSLLHEGMTVVDIGAHVGYYSLLAGMRVGGSGKVFSFEPEPKHFATLSKNVSLNSLKNVVRLQKALLDRNGTHQFYLAGGDLSRHGIYQQDVTVGQIEVATTTLDDFFSGRNETVQVIKMDAEGAEPLILEGMKDTIAKSIRLALFTEFFPPNLRLGGHSPEAYLEDLVRKGFILHLLDEEQLCVKRVTPETLLEIFRAEPSAVRNLLCLKGEGFTVNVPN